MGVLDVIGGLAKTAGAGFNAYGEEKKDRVVQALAADRAAREAKRDSVLNALTMAETDRLRAPTPPDLVPVYDPKTGAEVLTPRTPGLHLPGKPEYKIENGQRINATTGTAEPIAGYQAPEKPVAPSYTPVTLAGADGQPAVVKPFNTRTGEVGDAIGDAKPTGAASSGSAAMMKARAANVSQLAIIDDALKELDAHPSSVGLLRGLPMIGDILDPRVDPEGDAARAQIANIGSLTIHDRSGAAVSLQEFPRLAPFIPGIKDPPQTIRTKLQKLREAIQIETQAMGGGPLPSATKPPGAIPSFEEWLKTQGPPDA